MKLIFIIALITCLIGWLENKWTKYALIVWIIQKTNTQPSKGEMVKCKNFVIEHVIKDYVSPKRDFMIAAII